MKIEEFKNITIAYIRRTGNYGFENKIFMENFKEYLREKELLDKSSVILGIALDNPAMTDKNKLRYDVGLIVNGNPDIALDIRKIPDGIYAVFELPHTEQDTALKIEEFKNITIAYIRRTGNYGFENKIFMENFKEYLREKELLDKSSVILGIALDNPAMTDKNKLRYDVGLIVNGNPDIALDIRKIPDGIYAVFELPHTEQDITAFWSNIQKLVGSLSVDETKPVIERYPADKVAKHLCEFCIPLKKLS